MSSAPAVVTPPGNRRDSDGGVLASTPSSSAYFNEDADAVSVLAICHRRRNNRDMGECHCSNAAAR